MKQIWVGNSLSIYILFLQAWKAAVAIPRGKEPRSFRDVL